MKTWKFMIALMVAAAMLAGSAFAAPARLSSITTAVTNPVRVAIDSQGNLYVTEASENKIVKYDASGKYVGALAVPYPVSVAVDASGNIYTGVMVSSKKTGLKNAVRIYNASFFQTGMLGSGEGEFSFPVDIAIDGSGNILVVDKDRHTVSVYDPVTHAKVFSFGGFGNGNGQLTRPTSVAVNDAAGEIYVADAPQVMTTNGMTSGARISVFDKNGVFLRAIGQFGFGSGQITSPENMAVDRAGMLYVADSYQGAALIMNPADGSITGALYDTTAPMYNPSGIAMSRNGLVYIASKKGAGAGLGSQDRVDVYALDGYVTMGVTPQSLAFAATQFGGNPLAQTIVIANTGSGSLQWQASADASWIKLAQTSGTCGPQSSMGLIVSVDVSSLSLGTAQGTITIDSGFGPKQVVPVSVTVNQPSYLGISSQTLSFTSQKGQSPAPQNVTISIGNVSGTMAWSATSNASWLTINPASGSMTAAASSAVATVSVNTTGMDVGASQAVITVSAPGAFPNSAQISVSVAVTASNKIVVTTNRPDAGFKVSGPATFTGSGTNWSMENVPAGDYTVTFGSVAGFKTPFAQTKTVTTSGEVDFNATYLSYKDLAAKKNIAVAKGPAPTNDALVRLFKNNGTAEPFDLTALPTAYGANVAVGDVDGDGVAEVIVGAGNGPHNPATVRIYRADKSLLLEFVPFGTAGGGVNVAAADLNGDGKAEVLVSSTGGSDSGSEVAVYTLDAMSGKMVSTGIDFTAYASFSGANVTVADLDGNGKPYIVTAPGFAKGNDALIRIWKVDLSQGDGKWSASQVNDITLPGHNGASLAAADVDGDGADEIVAGTGGIGSGEPSMITVIKADGSKTSFQAFDHCGVNVAAADLDGDGMAEIIAACGRGSNDQGGAPDAGGKGKTAASVGKSQDGRNKHAVFGGADSESGTIRVTDGKGSVKFVIRPFANVQQGLNVAVGDLAL